MAQGGVDALDIVRLALARRDLVRLALARRDIVRLALARRDRMRVALGVDQEAVGLTAIGVVDVCAWEQLSTSVCPSSQVNA